MSSTPPPTDSPNKASPLRYSRFQGDFENGSIAAPDLAVKRRELRFSMHNKFIVVPTSLFMEKYAPPVVEKRNKKLSKILQDVPVESGKEKAMYAPINNICPDFTFVSTHSRGDPTDTSKEAPDIGLYPKDHAPSPSKRSNGRTLGAATNWTFVELCIECKTEGDPFDDKEPDFVAKNDEGKQILGQVLSYIELMFKRQHRTCIFLVLILGEMCRIIRFDRSGAVVTQAFMYKNKRGVLIEFLWRYARWDRSTRGHDPSVTLITPDSQLSKAMVARGGKDKDPKKPDDYVRQLFADSLNPGWSWWKFRVDDKKGPRYFVAGKPNFIASGVAGRGTRGFVALDEANLDGPFYYLKDAWRVSSHHIDKEGTTLRYLNKKGVHYVPTLECHGDVLEVQTTKTQDLWKELHEDGKPETTQAEKEPKLEEMGTKPEETGTKPEEAGTKPEETGANPEGTEAKPKENTCPFKKHKHYRIVVREVGQKMSKFSHSRELVYALRCCIVAHSEAYEHGVIHRDISAGNVLMYRYGGSGRWCGLLNDWELSKQTDSKTPHGRQLDRTGTWQFLSVSALDHPSKEITIEDELESFFHVLLFFAIRFLHHNCVDVGPFMFTYFDDHNTNEGKYICGTKKGSSVRDGSIILRNGSGTGSNALPEVSLTFRWPSLDSAAGLHDTAPPSHPLNYIFSTILEWIKSHYALMKSPNNSAPAQPSQSKAVDGFRARAVQDELEFFDGNQANPTGQSTQSQDEVRKHHEDMAKNLQSHGPILGLLRTVLTSPEHLWPGDEKTEDQLPEEGYKPKADPKAASADLRKGGSMRGNVFSTGSSLKRRSEHIEQPATQETPSKRAKSVKRKSSRNARERS
ncbi:hypothetical protein C8Q78DRAFT_1155390 [Trametes maxima]|nr:hypothetical protein C8Q78DRAFT_1155390 [Trametes maxima]